MKAGILGHRAGRPTHGIRLQAGSHLLSGLLVFVAIAIPANSKAMAAAKISVVFGAMLVSIILGLVVSLFGWIDDTSGQTIADRYATLTLMIT